MSEYEQWVQSVLNDMLLWLTTHGFQLNNRELASLFWLVVLSLWAISKPDIRAALKSVFRTAVYSKVVVVWIAYVVWMTIFVCVADWMGVWRAILTKDTLIWVGTAGVAILLSSADAGNPGYIKKLTLRLAGIIILVEYLVNLSTFPLIIELILQPLVALLLIAPIVVKDSDHKKIWRRIRDWFFLILTVVIVVYTARTLQVSWNTLDIDLVLISAIWPILLGFWIFPFVFTLAVVMGYEKAFLQLKWGPNEPVKLWRAKLAIILAFRLRLRLIHGAAKKGTNRVVGKNSLTDAYRAAKDLKAEVQTRKN